MGIDWSKYGVTDNSSIDWSKYGVDAQEKKPATANTAYGAPRFNVGEAVGQLGQGLAEGIPFHFHELAKKVLSGSMAMSTVGKMPTKGQKPEDFAKSLTEQPNGLAPEELPKTEDVARNVGRGVSALPAGVVGGLPPVAAVSATGRLAQKGAKGVDTQDLRGAASEMAMSAVPVATAGMGAKAIPAAAVGNYIASRVGGQDVASSLAASGIGALLSGLHLFGAKKMAGKPLPEAPPEAAPEPHVQKLIEAPGGGTMGASKLPVKEAPQLPAPSGDALQADQWTAFKNALATFREKGLGVQTRKVEKPVPVEPVTKLSDADPIQIKAQVGMDAARKKMIDGLLGRLDGLRSAPESPQVRRAFDATVRKLKAAGWQPEEGFVPTRLREQVGTELPEPPAPKPPTEPVPFKIGKNGPEGSPNTPEDVALLRKWQADKRAQRAATPEPEVKPEPVLPRATSGNWLYGSIMERTHDIIKKANPQLAEAFYKKARDMHGSTADFRGQIAGAGGDDAQRLANDLDHLAKDNGQGGSHLRDLLEGKAQPSSPKESQFRDLVWSVQKKTGEIAKSLGIMKGNPDGKLRIQFVTGQTKEMMTEEPAFRQALTDELVRLNSTRPSIVARAAKEKMKVEDFIRGLIAKREEAAANSPVVMPPSSRRQIAAEMERELTWPDYLKYKGKNVEVLESNPHNYVSRLLDQYSRRLAFVQHFEQGGGFEKYLQSVKAGTIGNPKVENAIRTFARLANGMNESPEAGIQLDPMMKKAGKVFWGAESVFRMGRLTASAINQIADALPWAPMYRWTSKGESVTAIKKMASQAPGWTRADLSKEGLLTKNVPNESFDPGRPVSSTMKNVLNRVSEFTFLRQMNEFGNEYMAAGQVKMALNRMRAAKSPDPKDVGRLIEMGYNMAEAKAIAGGKGSAQDYKNLGSELVNRMVSQPTLPTQRAASEYNPVTQFVVRIGRRWGTEAMRRTAQSIKAAKLAAQSGDPKMAAQIAGRAAVGAAVGGTLGNVATQIANSAAQGGERGAAAKMNAIKHHPKEELLGAFAGGNTAGPMSSLQSWVSAADPLRRAFENTALQPYVETGKMLRGDFPYKDLPTGEKAWRFSRRMVPGLKIAELGAAGIAKALGDKKLPARFEAESAGDDFAKWIMMYGNKFKKDGKWDKAAASADLRATFGDETYNILLKNQMIPWLKKTKGFVPEYRK